MDALTRATPIGSLVQLVAMIADHPIAGTCDSCSAFAVVRITPQFAAGHALLKFHGTACPRATETTDEVVELPFLIGDRAIKDLCPDCGGRGRLGFDGLLKLHLHVTHEPTCLALSAVSLGHKGNRTVD